MDPAKAPLGSSPYPRSKLYVKRKRRKEELLSPQELVKPTEAVDCQEPGAGVPSVGASWREDSSGGSSACCPSDGNEYGLTAAREVRGTTAGHQPHVPTVEPSKVGEPPSPSTSHSRALHRSKGDVESGGESRECVGGSSNHFQVNKQVKGEHNSKLPGVLEVQPCSTFDDQKAVSLSTIVRPIPISGSESKFDTWPPGGLADPLDCTHCNTASTGQLFIDPSHPKQRCQPAATISRHCTRRQHEGGTPRDSSPPTPVGRCLLTPSGNVAGKVGTWKGSDGNGVKSLFDEVM